MSKYNQLMADYPEIFVQKDLSMQETCMCRGCECGEGWYEILDILCARIMYAMKIYDCKVEAVQVKEKYGVLRFYYNIIMNKPPARWENTLFGILSWIDHICQKITKKNHYLCDLLPFRKRAKRADDFVFKIAHDAEKMSSRTCEICGKPGTMNKEKYWCLVRCDACRNE